MPDFCWNDTGALGRPASDTYEDLTHLDKTGASAYRRLIRQLVDGQRHSDCPIDFSPLPTRARCSARPERLTGRMQIHENPVSILAAWSPITKCMSLASVHCNPRQNGLQGLKRARSSVRIERWSPERILDGLWVTPVTPRIRNQYFLFPFCGPYDSLPVQQADQKRTIDSRVRTTEVARFLSQVQNLNPVLTQFFRPKFSRKPIPVLGFLSVVRLWSVLFYES